MTAGWRDERWSKFWMWRKSKLRDDIHLIILQAKNFNVKSLCFEPHLLCFLVVSWKGWLFPDHRYLELVSGWTPEDINSMQLLPTPCFWLQVTVVWKSLKGKRVFWWSVQLWRHTTNNALFLSHLDICRSFQITGDLDIEGAVVLWGLFVQINVCVLDHLKCAMMRKEGTWMGE